MDPYAEAAVSLWVVTRGQLQDLGLEGEALLSALQDRGLATFKQVDKIKEWVRAEKAWHAAVDPGSGIPAEVRDSMGAPENRVGRRYVLLKETGSVGASDLWTGWDVVDKIRVMVRLLDKSASSDAIARFRREAEVQRKFDHPGIPRLLASGSEEKSGQFLVGESVSGRSLLEMAVPMEAKRAAEIVRDAALIIEHVHERNVVHRDLRPRNILITKDGTVALQHFLLARLLQGSTLTATRLHRDHYGYMAPEQAEGEKADFRSDTYALGAVLFYLLAGRAPFEGDKVMKVLSEVTKKPAPSPRSFNKVVPRALEAVIRKALEKERPKRFQRAKHVAEALDEFLKEKPKGLFSKLFGR